MSCDATATVRASVESHSAGKNPMKPTIALAVLANERRQMIRAPRILQKHFLEIVFETRRFRVSLRRRKHLQPETRHLSDVPAGEIPDTDHRIRFVSHRCV
jgi:hypothetical protein